MHWAVYVAKEVTRVSNSQFRCVEYMKVMGSEERFGEMKGKCGRRGQRWINNGVDRGRRSQDEKLIAVRLKYDI